MISRAFQGLALSELHSHNRRARNTLSLHTRAHLFISHSCTQELHGLDVLCHPHGNGFILWHRQACLRKDAVIITALLFVHFPSLGLSPASSPALRTGTLGIQQQLHLSSAIHTEQLITGML